MSYCQIGNISKFCLFDGIDHFRPFKFALAITYHIILCNFLLLCCIIKSPKCDMFKSQINKKPLLYTKVTSLNHTSNVVLKDFFLKQASLSITYNQKKCVSSCYLCTINKKKKIPYESKTIVK